MATSTHTSSQLIASGNNTVPVLLINADGVETRLVNPRVIKQGGKKPWVKTPLLQRQGRASRSSHHFHFHRKKFAYSSILLTEVGRASRSLSAAEDAFQCTLSSKSVASQKQRNFLETQRNFLSSKRSYPSSKSVACVFVHNC